MLEGEESLDIDLIFMINFVKIHMIAVNYKDAGLLQNPELCKDMTDREKYYAESLKECVSFFDFWNYMMFCGSSFSGPAVEYRKFDEFINKKGQFEKIPKAKLFIPAMTRFAQMILCLVIVVVLNMSFKLSFLVS